MKKSILTIFLIIFSLQGWSQKSHNHFQNHNIHFAGNFIAGLLLNEVFDLDYNYRKMNFVYNHKKEKWRLKKDIFNHSVFHPYRTGIIAQFENPNGGRDFFVKINKRGRWFIDAPKRFKKMLKNKVLKNI